MITDEQIRETLNQVMLPGIRRTIGNLNLIREVKIVDQTIKITVASTVLNTGSQDWIKKRAERVLKELPGVSEVEVAFIAATPAELNQISHIIAVMSGKGGVGKSVVSSLISIALNRRSYSVGILDADITGPSIPRMFGIAEPPVMGEGGILPVLSGSGIGIMSINLLLRNEDDAVIWRGPLIGRAINQFRENVLWGKLDFLIIDLPPGTADAPLTVMQSFPVSGVVIVFTPQDLTAMIVRKAVNMARSMNKPILGVVENMAYLYVAEIDKKIEIFGRSRGQEMAESTGAPLLGQLPIDPELARLCDQGKIEDYKAEVVSSLGDSLLQALPAKTG